MINDNDKQLKSTNESPKADQSAKGPEVFISYSSVNKDVADALVSNFEQHGVKCWYAPRDIMPGQEWVTAINDAIKACKVFILVYTSNSNMSRQVANEVALAFNSGKTLVPFRLSEDEMSAELAYYLMRVHWMDAVNPPLGKNIEKLREYSEKIINGTEKMPIIPESEKEKGKKNSSKWKIVAAVLGAVLIITCVAILYRNPDKKSSDSKADSSKEYPVTENTPAEKRDLTETIAPTQKAPEEKKENDVNELYELAYKYQMGEEGGKKPLTAYEYYMKTGDTPTESKAIAEAIYKLGNQFCNGEGIEQDYEKGMALYQKAIASGNTSAMNMMGNLYLYGDGVEEDYKEAEKYYRMAADQGDETGIKNLEYIRQLMESES